MFASDLDVYEDYDDIKSNFIQDLPAQYPMLSKRERFGESMVRNSFC